MTHERWGATDEPSKNGQLCYQDDIDRPLREAAQKKVLKYQNANSAPRFRVVRTTVLKLENALSDGFPACGGSFRVEHGPGHHS